MPTMSRLTPPSTQDRYSRERTSLDVVIRTLRVPLARAVSTLTTAGRVTRSAEDGAKPHRDAPTALVPMVVPPHECEVSFRVADHRRVYSAEPRAGELAETTVPWRAHVFVHDAPSDDGRPRSPVQSVESELLMLTHGARSRISACGLRAEASRTRQTLVTLEKNDLSSGALFFDSDSRTTVAAQNLEEDALRQRAIQQMLQETRKCQGGRLRKVPRVHQAGRRARAQSRSGSIRQSWPGLAHAW